MKLHSGKKGSVGSWTMRIWISGFEARFQALIVFLFHGEISFDKHTEEHSRPHMVGIPSTA